MADKDKNHESLTPGTGTQTLVRPDSETKQPALYKVIILNDDFTPRDFVVHVLVRFFSKDETDANRLMLEVHHQGAGLAGTFTYEVAETKTYQVNNYARQHQFPLKCVMEAE
jgi:ATP-dependent Clp protease adaptor protein ClpS